MTLRSWLLTTDHKRIAILYLVAMALFGASGGAAAGLLRLELLAAPAFHVLVDFHGHVMVFLLLLPAIPAGLGYFVLPPMTGAPNVAFPRLALLSWYLFVLAGAAFVRQFVSAEPDALAAQLLAVLSLVLSALNFIVTIHRRYADGLPTFARALYVASFAGLAAAIAGMPGLAVAMVPAFGVIGEVIGEKAPSWLLAAIAGATFVPWGSRLLLWELPPAVSFLALLALIPPAALVLRWLVALVRRPPVRSAAQAHAWAFLGLAIASGCTSPLLAIPAANTHLAATQFETAHFHYIAGCVVMAFLAGLHHWWPQITGRRAAEGRGRTAALILFTAWNLTFFPQFLLGYLGLPQRAHGHPALLEILNVASSLGAAALLAAFVLSAIGLLWPLFHDPRR